MRGDVRATGLPIAGSLKPDRESEEANSTPISLARRHECGGELESRGLEDDYDTDI